MTKKKSKKESRLPRCDMIIEKRKDCGFLYNTLTELRDKKNKQLQYCQRCGKMLGLDNDDGETLCKKCIEKGI